MSKPPVYYHVVSEVALLGVSEVVPRLLILHEDIQLYCGTYAVLARPATPPPSDGERDGEVSTLWQCIPFAFGELAVELAASGVVSAARRARLERRGDRGGRRALVPAIAEVNRSDARRRQRADGADDGGD